jgi:hypothetical protein
VRLEPVELGPVEFGPKSSGSSEKRSLRSMSSWAATGEREKSVKPDKIRARAKDLVNDLQNFFDGLDIFSPRLFG